MIEKVLPYVSGTQTPTKLCKILLNFDYALYLEKEEQQRTGRKPAVLLLCSSSSVVVVQQAFGNTWYSVCVFIEGAPVPLSSNATVIGPNKEPSPKNFCLARIHMAYS